MQFLLRSSLLLALVMTIGFSGGCGTNAPNPDLKVPDVPPSTRKEKKGSLTPDLKDPGKDARPKDGPEK